MIFFLYPTSSKQLIPCINVIPLLRPDVGLGRVDRVLRVQLVNVKSGFRDCRRGRLLSSAMSAELLLLVLSAQTSVDVMVRAQKIYREIN